MSRTFLPTPNFLNSFALLTAMSISLGAMACIPAFSAESTSQQNATGESKVPLTAEEKEIAAKLGFDEAVLALIKESLNAEFGIVSADTDEANSRQQEQPHVFRGDEHPTAPLIEKDLANYKKIAQDYPELADIVNQQIEWRAEDRRKKAIESIVAEKGNTDDLRRQKRYFDFCHQNGAQLQQYLDDLRKENNLTGNQFITLSSPDFTSDEAVDKKIAEMQGLLKNIVLRDEYKSKSILGIRYKCDGWGMFGPDKRVDKLQMQLDSLGYKISPIMRSPSVAKMFETREEAIAFLASYGIKQFDGLSMSEQRAQKYEGIYPIDYKKDTQSQEDLRTLILQSSTFLDKSDTKSLDELGADLKARLQLPEKVKTEMGAMMGADRGMRIEPGTIVKKIGERRWSLDRPARYEARATIKIATAMKMPKDDFGIELVRSQGTNGLNYSVDNDMVIEKLKKWNKQYGISVLEASHDSMTVKFKNLPDDLSELVTEYFLFDPEMEVHGTEQYAASVMRETAKKLRQTHTLSFWWD